MPILLLGQSKTALLGLPVTFLIGYGFHLWQMPPTRTSIVVQTDAHGSFCRCLEVCF